jgi:hypothetical protein
MATREQRDLADVHDDCRLRHPSDCPAGSKHRAKSLTASTDRSIVSVLRGRS